MMTDWYQKSINAVALNGKAGRTREAYSRALHMLCEFCNKRPEDISEKELEEYFLHRRNVSHWLANTPRICCCGSRANRRRCACGLTGSAVEPASCSVAVSNRRASAQRNLPRNTRESAFTDMVIDRKTCGR